MSERSTITSIKRDVVNLRAEAPSNYRPALNVEQRFKASISNATRDLRPEARLNTTTILDRVNAEIHVTQVQIGSLAAEVRVDMHRLSADFNALQNAQNNLPTKQDLDRLATARDEITTSIQSIAA